MTAETTYNQASAWGATYYFTLKLPASSVNVPLKQLAFTQVEGLESIDFDDKNSIAFVETNGQREKLGVTLAKKEINRKPSLLPLTNQLHLVKQSLSV